MRTITFYSYKGGVGRTLAAANFALYLAKLGYKTAMIDFDLDAPGLDSKLDCQIPQNHFGLLDYILEYQRTGSDPGPVDRMCITVPIEASNSDTNLWLIAAGDYLATDYTAKLNELNWQYLFSEERDGAAFFQKLVSRVSGELRPDFLIVDSRTGISEIGGLCTQQLADEVVVLSSLSRESVKVTKHIARLIRQSEVARALGKSIDVKVVVSRVPRPADLSSFQEKCGALFGVDSARLFFLFSCPALESEEFLAIGEPFREEELIGDYVRLFYGLDIELATRNIESVIEEATSSLLTSTPDDAENRMLELSAFYPHPDAYRAVMRYFRLVDKPKEMRKFGARLLDLSPGDSEAHRVLANSYLEEYAEERELSPTELTDAARAIKPVWEDGDLTADESILLASILEDLNRFDESLNVALELSDEENQASEAQVEAHIIAARSSLQLGRRELAGQLLANVPKDRLRGTLGLFAIEVQKEADGAEAAFDLAKEVLSQDFNWQALESAADLARQLNRVNDLEEVIRESDGIRRLSVRRGVRSRSGLVAELRRLGLYNVARDPLLRQ